MSRGLYFCRIVTAITASAMLVLSRTAIAQSTQPTVDPASPKGVIIAYQKALNDGDGTALHGLLLTTTPTEERIAGSMVDSVSSLSTLLKKAVAKFGPEAAHSAFGDPGVADKYVSENIVKSTETVTGDTATVTLNASGQGTMTLKKVDGKWKISVGEMVKDVPADNLEKVLKSVESGNAIEKQMAADIEAGKYPTAEAAKSAFNEKIFEVKAEAAAEFATTQPTTKPM